MHSDETRSRYTIARAAARLLPVALVMMAAAPVSGAQAAEADPPLAGRNVAFLVGEGVHDGETLMPMAYLVNRGARVTIIGVAPGEVTAYNSDFRVRVERGVEDASVDDFDALVIPGGRSPAVLREHDAVVDFARRFFTAGKPVAAICHGPQVLTAAGVLEGLHVTAVGSIRDELTQAGARYADEPVVLDHNLITSRVPADLPEFSRSIEHSLLGTAEDD